MGKTERTPFSKFLYYLPFCCFVVAILCLCFVYGIAVGKWHVFPHGFLNAGWDSLKELWTKSTRPHHIFPARYEGEEVVVCEREKVFLGVTLLTGYWRNGDDWSIGIRSSCISALDHFWKVFAHLGKYSIFKIERLKFISAIPNYKPTLTWRNKL